MHKRVAMTMWFSALMAGWLFWTDPGAAAGAPKVYAGLSTPGKTGESF
jgi:hypothetical protein